MWVVIADYLLVITWFACTTVCLERLAAKVRPPGKNRDLAPNPDPNPNPNPNPIPILTLTPTPTPTPTPTLTLTLTLTPTLTLTLTLTLPLTPTRRARLARTGSVPAAAPVQLRVHLTRRLRSDARRPSLQTGATSYRPN